MTSRAWFAPYEQVRLTIVTKPDSVNMLHLHQDSHASVRIMDPRTETSSRRGPMVWPTWPRTAGSLHAYVRIQC